MLVQERDGQNPDSAVRGGLACWKLLCGQFDSIMCRRTKFMLDLPLAHGHATLPLFALISISKATVFYILPFTTLYLEVGNLPEMK